MLLKLSGKIKECLAYAAEARRRAGAAADPGLSATHLDMEARWLRLVESYRFVEQASRFLDDARAHSATKLADTGALVVRCPNTGREFSTGILTDEESLALFPRESIYASCPYCNVEHEWPAHEAKFVGGLLPVNQPVHRPSLGELLDVLVRTAVEQSGSKARAAFYIADSMGTALHHVTGMPEAYARRVDGFAIGPQSLACGLAAAVRKPIITPDVTQEPLWRPWLSLAEEFDYRACWSFPVESTAGKVVGTFAMYYREPREASPRDLDIAALLTRTAGAVISERLS